jgi:hypothetical protein
MSSRLPPHVSPEEGRDARAKAWSFVLECWRKKQEGGPPTALENAKEERIKDDFRAET